MAGMIEKLKDLAKIVQAFVFKEKQKSGVLGQLKMDAGSDQKDRSTQRDIPSIDLSPLEKFPIKKIAFFVLLLLGGIALAAILLWTKLTTLSHNYSSSQPLENQAPKVELEQNAGFLPGKSVLIKPKPETKQEENPPQSDHKDEQKNSHNSVIELHEKKIESVSKPETKTLARIMPSSNTAQGISQTINPQYLVENPILKVQKAVLILKGFGLNKIHGDSILDEIYDDIVVAIDPYTTGLQDEIGILTDYGFDVLVTIPLEDMNPRKDQGHLTVRTTMKPTVREKVLGSVLDVSVSAQGILFSGGRKLLKSPADVQALVTYLSAHDKFVVLGDDVLNNKFFKIADASSLNYLVVAADNCPMPDVDQILGMVRRTGFVILSFDINTPDVVDKIKQWIKVLDENKIDVVSISNLLKKND